VAACFGGGVPHVAGSFLFLLVSDAVDVEGTGDGVCKMSEEPSETSFSLWSASVITVADTDGAVEGMLWREHGDGLCNYLGHVCNRETETDAERHTERILTEGKVLQKT